jgi:diguanylate cyclase (GGDEF)-like protein
LREVEKSSGSEGLADKTVLYLQGGGKNITDLYKPQESWADRIHDYIENATQERYFDETTGCYNRKYFSQAISQILNTQLMCSLTESKKPLTLQSYSYAIYLVDIDHFKMINDEFGHNYGDQVLSQVGATLKNTVGSDGIVIRNGGEEFLLIVCLGYPLDYSGLAEKIRSDFNETVYVSSLLTHEIRPVTCSIGYVPFPVFGDNRTAFSVSQYVNLADQAMYKAKTEGRNTWRGISPANLPPTGEEYERAALSMEYGMKAGYFRIEKPALIP